MDNLQEILGSKKVALGVNSDIKTRVILSQPGTLNVESSLFLDINQDEQYVMEKRESYNFRFYGSVAPIINKQAYKKSGNNLIPINLDTKILDFNTDNWSMAILQPKKYNNTKGMKILTNKFGSIDFSNGLPAVPVRSKLSIKEATYKGLLLYLGHNFVVDDKIYIKSMSDDGYIKTGIYSITKVEGNKIYTNELFRLDSTVESNAVYGVNNNAAANVNNVTLNNPSNTKATTKTIPPIKIDKTAGLVNVTVNDVDLGYFDESGITNFISERPSGYKTLRPTLFVRKIVENEILEYYVKTGVVVDTIDTLDNCGFSLSAFGVKRKNYVFDNTIDTTYLQDNLGNPITHMYLGVIKNGSTTQNNFSDVEANFSNLIEFTNLDEGYQIVNTKSASTVSQKCKVGDEFIISVCEYSTEQLTEVEIANMEHRFIHNDVLFHYDPFTKIDLKLMSSYIETGESVINIPDYAVYSKTRDTYIWKDIYDVGISNENGESIDFPFLNNSFYVFRNINFFLNIEKNKTPKYKIGKNDLTNIKGGTQLENEIIQLTDGLNVDNEVDRPFKAYKGIQC